MATGLLPDLSTQDATAESMHATGDIPASSPLSEPQHPTAEPAYLTRLATLPETSPHYESPESIQRPEAARLDQIEHALTILASVVARLAKEAQQSRLQLRATEHDPGLQEERRVQRELVRSMQARLHHLEERLDLERESRLDPPLAIPAASTEGAEQMTQSLQSIRDSLAALARRRARQAKHGTRS